MVGHFSNRPDLVETFVSKDRMHLLFRWQGHNSCSPCNSILVAWPTYSALSETCCPFHRSNGKGSTLKTSTSFSKGKGNSSSLKSPSVLVKGSPHFNRQTNVPHHRLICSRDQQPSLSKEPEIKDTLKKKSASSSKPLHLNPSECK